MNAWKVKKGRKVNEGPMKGVERYQENNLLN